MYDSDFFTYTDRIAARSAAHLLPLVQRCFQPRSVVEFGCANGAWLKVWGDLGVADYIGVDGHWVDTDRLLIESSRFIAHDLSEPLRLGRTFDFVQSLEVAEHLPPASADTFVDTLAAHGRTILFSAAPPGDGGLHHVNEQPYEYWRDLFDQRGYRMVDLIRPQVIGNRSIEPWYRYNCFVFAHQSILADLPEQIQTHEISANARVPDVSPLVFRIRKAMLRKLPVRAVDCLSRLYMRMSRLRHRS